MSQKPKLSKRKLRRKLNEMMVIAGHDPYDHNINLDINLSFDFGTFFKGLNLGKLQEMFSNAREEAKGIIKVKPSLNKPGIKTKEKVIDGAAPLNEPEDTIHSSTGKQELENSTLGPQDEE